MAWFQEWFDTPFYEQLYSHRDNEEARKLAKLISDFFPPSKYPTALDLACGRGRHSYNLANLGYHVMGLDLSPNAIQKARELTPKHITIKPEFGIHDMRNPVGNQFHLVVNLFTSFGYFEEEASNQLVIKNFADAVSSDGALVIDFLNPTFVKINLIPHEKHTIGEYEVEIDRFVERDMVKKHIQFTHPDTNERQTFTEQVKLYEASWFEHQLLENHLRIQQMYGDYDGKEYNMNHSSRLILFAKKA